MLCIFEGCGKTSLLNVLAGKVSLAGSNDSKLSGKIYLNGKERNEKAFYKQSSYVLQVLFVE